MTAQRNELDRLYGMLFAMGCGLDGVKIIVIPGDPWSKMRARHAQRGRKVMTYQPKEDTAAETRTASYLRELFTAPEAGNLAMAVLCYRVSRIHVDYDNLAKHIGDAGNGVAWVDDSQITAGCVVVEYDHDDPRTIIAIARHYSSMKRGSDAMIACEACGMPFEINGPRRFCGTKCSGAARRKGYVPFAAGKEE